MKTILLPVSDALTPSGRGKGALLLPLLALLTLAFALPARAVDYYFDSDDRRLEQLNGTPFSPQAVAGVTASGSPTQPGVLGIDGVVEFTFPATLSFGATDRVFFRGSRAVRIVVAGNITIPAGASIDASGALGGAGGGLGGGGGGTAGPGGPGRAGPAGGAAGLGGVPSGATPSYPHNTITQDGRAGGFGTAGGAVIDAFDGGSNAGGNGFGQPASGAPGVAGGQGGNGGAATVVRALAGPGGAAGVGNGDGSDGGDGGDGPPGLNGTQGSNGSPGNGGRYANPTRVLLGGGGGSSGGGGGEGGGGGSGGSGAGGGGGGTPGLAFLGIIIAVVESGSNGGAGGAGGDGGRGGAGTNGGSGGQGGGAVELRATGSITVGGIVRANGASGSPGGGGPALGANGTAGAPGTPGVVNPDSNSLPDGGSGGDGGDGGPGGRGGDGGVGGPGGGGAGGTIILKAGVGIQKLTGAVIEAHGGAGGGPGAEAGAAGGVFEDTPLGLLGLEDFAYTAGTSLVGQTGGTFFDWNNVTRTHTGTRSPWFAAGGTSPVVDFSPTGPVKLITNSQGAARPYGANEANGAFNGTGVVYYKIEMTRRASATESGLASENFGTARAFFGVPDAVEPGSGQRRFAIERRPSGIKSYSTIAPVTGRRYTLVAKVDFDQDLLSLWVDPRLGLSEAQNPPVATLAHTESDASTAVRVSSQGVAEWDNLAVAATWETLAVTVTTATDEDNGNLSASFGAGISLREAVNHAPSGSLILFAPHLSGGTITLGSQLVLNRNVTIDASDLPGGLTLSGGSDGDATVEAGETRHLRVENGAIVQLTALTLADGMAATSGGSIEQFAGELTVDRCLFLRNRTLGSGGAIAFTNGFLIVRNSTLVENTAAVSGGAILASQTTALLWCTITGNQAGTTAGGIRRTGSQPVLLGACIVAENTAPTDPDHFGGVGFFPDCVVGGDPRLAPLGAYGGPTLTRPPFVGSPAIDIATSTDPVALDQRGFPRQVDGDAIVSVLADAGAVEAGPLLVVNSLADAGGPADLRTLLGIAATIPGARIGFHPTLFNPGETIFLAGTQLTVPTVAGGVFFDATNISVAPGISADGLSRVLQVPAGASATLWNLRITGGKAIAEEDEIGGGILNQGTLTLNRCTVSGNSAFAGGGISNTGRLVVIDSTIADNGQPSLGASLFYGGGIYSGAGSVLIERSSVVRNTARYGGGGVACARAKLTMRNSTVAGNSSDDGGGGLFFTSADAATLEFTTIAGNTAPNGGGIRAIDNTPVSLRGCVVAGNTATNGTHDIDTFAGATITLSGPNLIGDNTGSGLAAAPPLIGTASAPVNARLSVLGSYGGHTETMLPLPGSPSLGAATSNLPTTDQRGFSRPNPSELGAVEVGTTDYYTVTTTTDNVAGSLRQRLLDAPSGGLIVFDPAVFPGGVANRIALTTGLTAPTGKTLILDATDAGGLTLDGGGLVRVLNVPAGSILTLKAMTLRGGVAIAGGAVRNQGDLTLERCTLTANRANDAGGAIENLAGNLLLDRCTLTGNSAATTGGALVCRASAGAILRGCTVSENTAGTAGGGIANAGTLVLGGTIIAGNFLTAGGVRDDLAGTGDFFTDGGNLLGVNAAGVIASAFPAGLPNANTDFVGAPATPLDPRLSPLAPRGGPTETMPPLPGSPALDRATASIASTDQRGFPRAIASTLGGSAVPDIGAVERGPVVLVTNTDDSGAGSLRDTLAAATAPDTRITFDPGLNGQTITLSSPDLSIPATQNVEIDASALPLGLAISGNQQRRVMNNAGILSLQRLTVRDGSTTGAGAGVRSDGSLLAVDCTISGNTTTNIGGGVSVFGGGADLLRCTISENTAGGGGGFAVNGGRVTLTNCTVAHNRATISGNPGGIGNYSGTLVLRHTTVTQNVGNGGGGLSLFQSSASVSVERCIIAGNRDLGSTRADISFVSSGTLTPIGPSFIGSNESVATQFPAGPLVGTALAPLDPQLGPLAPRGAPTATMPPLTGSAAIDAGGAPTTLLADQRGLPRPIGAQVDLGAAERGPLLTVTNTNDAGPGSLRDTLAAATTPDTRIVFNSALNGQTISLTSDVLFIPSTRNVEIDANSLPAGISVSGNNARRVLLNFGVLSLHRLTLRDGSASQGAGMLSAGSLLAVDCTLTGNTAAGFGGGLSLSGNTADLLRCTISHNTAGSGGGISQFFAGRTTLTNCTVAENRSTLAHLTAVGGITVTGSTLALRHTTITQNVSDGAGGGLLLSDPGSVSIERCVIAGNRALGSAADIYLESGTLTPIGPNLIGDNTGSGLAAVPGLIGTALAPIDPSLGPLAPRGALTATAPPLTGSPALDAGGAPTTLFADQRSLPRTPGAAVDLGAAERGPLLTVTNTNDAGPGSLRDALAAATTPDTRINFDSGLNGATIPLTSAELSIGSTRNVEIDASALPAGIAVSGNNARRVLSNSGVVSLHRLTLRDGSATSGGGGLSSGGTLLAADCTIAGNTTTTNGGGVFLAGGVADFHRCTISGNTASSTGGLWQQGTPRTTLTNCTVADNRVTGTSAAGGFTVLGGTLALRHTTVTQNVGNGFSGGMLVQSPASVSVERSIIAANRDPGSNRADLFFFSGTLTPIGPSLIGSNESVATPFPTGPLAGTALAPLDPRLAPLDGYTGPTFTTPPIPGSPAINAAPGSPTDFDQRGFARSGPADLGAAEFRGAPDVRLYWLADWDADGSRSGLEHALGTDPLRSDRNNARNLTPPIIDGLGRPQVTFGVNAAFIPGTQWILTRSTTLQAGSFTEIFRFDGTAYTFNSAQVAVVDNGTTITVIDRLPPVGKGFYRLEALAP